ncbi:VTT domain-containing protein [Lysinibacillus xylanilyticus]|uniref:VTT domain-containing protein n=1 Tax=Lysinibacillus xylanilyticus TaxID=582475 RepID=A0ABT4EIQ4_9BACI|nr:VTT domain-containing protein [Lysinibacillus xylanilyticus]MCY9545534.1 VTT domain-containing protein [Lysinibacillus xylanilyticus]MED3801688.1 VTT domain-containing protein [Lysinibacillus xylanilyticus]
MELIKELISFIMHIDVHLEEIIREFGNFSYFVLFAIVFVETGVVIFPFLPGDSLLFASGTLAAAMGAFNMWILIPVFLAAAILGDTMNYHIGHKVGTSIPPKSFLGRVVKKERMEAAEKFFNKHGGKTIVIARFMPFIRTFIPFVAGASKMKYGYFIMYNVLGAVLWVFSCTLLGYFFGNIPIIKDNFSTVLILIILISVVPAVIGAIKAKASGK